MIGEAEAEMNKRLCVWVHKRMLGNGRDISKTENFQKSFESAAG